MDSIVTVLVEVSGEKSTRERNKMCCQSFGIAKNTCGSSVFCLINNNVQYHLYVFTLCSSRGQSS